MQLPPFLGIAHGPLRWLGDRSGRRRKVTRGGNRGIRTLAATNGQSGIELYQAYQDDIYLIILDLSMPGLNGEQTFRKLHQINPDVRVLLSSGYNQAEAIQRFDGKELTGFIQKPYSAITLIKKVQQILLPG